MFSVERFSVCLFANISTEFFFVIVVVAFCEIFAKIFSLNWHFFFFRCMCAPINQPTGRHSCARGGYHFMHFFSFLYHRLDCPDSRDLCAFISSFKSLLGFFFVICFCFWPKKKEEWKKTFLISKFKCTTFSSLSQVVFCHPFENPSWI